MSIERVTEEAVQFALSNGVAMGVRGETSLTRHAPFILFPSPVPRKAFEQAWDLASCFGTLIHRVASDPLWIIEALSPAAEADPFTASLLNILKETIDRETGDPLFSPWSFGLHRSDYMLHLNSGPQDFEDVKLTQVEINTISSSFPSLSQRVSNTHSHLLRWLNDNFSSPTRDSWNEGKEERWDVDRLPPNDLPQQYSEAILKAHNIFLSCHGDSARGKRVAVLFVVQPNERNFLDQRFLQYHLESIGIQVIRRTLFELSSSLSVDPESQNLLFSEVSDPPSGFLDAVISVVYFRSAYSPSDFPSSSEWTARERIEKSVAIKCPTISYHLAGTKKIQQLLSDPKILSRFLGDEPKVMEKIQQSFTGLYEIDKTSPVFRRAVDNPSDFVMKPQREGGGNLIFGEKIREVLLSSSDDLLSTFILMDRIHVRSFKTWIVSNSQPHLISSVSELGIYTAFLGDNKQRVEINKAVGSLLRTKPESEADGGVAAGVAALDSVYLTD